MRTATHLPRLFSRIACVFCLSGAASLNAAGPATAPSIDPAAQNVLQDATRYLRGLASYQVEIEHLRDFGTDPPYRIRQQLSARRPDKLTLVCSSTDLIANLFADGKQIVSFAPSQDRYLLVDAPSDLFHLTIVMRHLGITWWPLFGPLLVTNPHESTLEYLLQDIRAGRYVDEQAVEGAGRCHHLLLSGQDGSTFELWIQTGKTPLIRKTSRGTGPGRLEGQPVRETVFLNGWKINPNLPDETFKFKPRAGITAVRSEYQQSLFKYERNPLLGKTAPDFTLDLVQGGKVNLRSHLGKNIVVLDFWATWCVSCNERLPKTIRAAKKLEGKGVVLYAIDVKESPEVVRRHLEKRPDQNCRMLLDQTGSVMDLYAIELIPSLVIIDRNGIVRGFQCVSFVPDYDEKRLMERIEVLLAATSTSAPG